MERKPKITKTNLMRAEAAQYALLCRIAPALRHRLVGRLHPIGLTAGVAHRQLRDDRANLAGARDSVAQVQVQVREAMVSAIETLAWLTGEESASVALKTGVDACIALVRTDCEMRGVTVSSEITETDTLVSQRALRIVLTASLFSMVDTLPYICRIALRSAIAHGTIEIYFDMDFADTAQTPSVENERRHLKWDDVKALAAHEGVGVFRSGKPLIVKCRLDVIVAKTQSVPGNISLTCNA